MKRNQGYLFSLLFIFSAAVLANHALFNDGFPVTHESLTPLQNSPVARLIEVDKNVKAGVFPVVWFPDSAGGGTPEFNFYPPLAYYLAEVFHLMGFSYYWSIKVLIVLSYFLSGFSMFLFVRHLTKDVLAGLVSSVTYVFSPYHFADFNLRGDVSETMAFAFIPLLFFFLSSNNDSKTSVRSICAGISFACLIMTNNVVAVITILPVLIFFVHDLLGSDRIRTLTKYLTVGVTGVGLSAFYWLPALREIESVNYGFLTAGYFDLGNHALTFGRILSDTILLSWKFGFSGPNGGDQPQGIGMAVLLAGVAGLILVLAPRKIRERSEIAVFFASFSLSLLLTTYYAIPFLRAITFLKFMQFPWRFFIITSFSGSVMLGLIFLNVSTWMEKKRILRVSTKIFIFFLIVFLVGAGSYVYTFVPGGYYYNFPSNNTLASTFYHEEYLPVNAKPLPSVFPEINSSCKESFLVDRTPVRWVVNTESDTNCRVDFRIFYFPGWRVLLDGKEVNPSVESRFGTIAVYVPQGSHVIEVEFSDTIPRSIGKVMSLLTFCSICLATLCLKVKGKHPGLFERKLERTEVHGRRPENTH